MKPALHNWVRVLPSTLLLLVLVSSISPSADPSVAAQSLPATHSSLGFTVEPDRSLSVSLNTTSTNLMIPHNVSILFPPGNAIHSTSSFSQQTNAVVQTSTTQYQLPQSAIYQPPLNGVSSMSFTATQTGTSGQGSLHIDTYPTIPVSNIRATYSYSPSNFDATASAQLHFSPAYSGGPLNFLSSESQFNTNWTATFGNPTWINMIKSQIYNSTGHIVTVTNLNGTVTYPDGFTANVVITLDAVPSAGATDFAASLEQALTSLLPTLNTSQLASMIQQILALSTSESFSLTYSGSTALLTIQSTTNYVPDLDSRLNSLKTQFIQLIPGISLLPPNVQSTIAFVNSTSISVTHVSMTSDLDLNESTARTNLQGLVLRPPTVGSNTNFTIPGLFQTLGMMNLTGTEITLAGGSNSSFTVRVVVPPGTPQPTSTTADSYTWTLTNTQNATQLQNVRFELVASGGLLALLTSPTALVVEGVAAIAIVAGVVLLMRRKRAAVPAPTPVMGPAPTPGPSPAPPSPAPANP